MYNVHGDQILIDTDQDGDITITTFDSETSSYAQFDLAILEAEFLSLKLQERIQEAKAIRDDNKQLLAVDNGNF